MLPIHPSQLRHVEHGGALVDSVHIKRFNQLLSSIYLLVGTLTPSQQGQVVDHGIGQEPLLSELVDRSSTVALGQLAAIFTQDKRAVSKLWNPESQRSLNQDLSHRIGQVLFGANDHSHAHERIIHGHTKVIYRYTVGSKQDKVSYGRFGVPFNMTTDDVLDFNAGSRRHAESNGVWITTIDLGFYLFGISISPCAIILGIQTLLLSDCSLSVELLLRTETRISQPGVHKQLGEVFVDISSLRLAI
mmetsp:Transcript_11088/g.18988  ORF Transcript_11088/g.18988 Transcript_11088/m.18988 type:complete len:246 (+) Transcript_11088:557-1294(+)